jgi:hypothetical protein
LIAKQCRLLDPSRLWFIDDRRLGRKEPNMVLIGVDYHPSFQTMAFLIEETGEYDEQELSHSDGQAEKFHRGLKQRGLCVRVGMEATGCSRWFERLVAELGFELWIGDPAEIKAKRVKKQKFDREDARLLLRLLRENSCPQIWIPDPEIGICDNFSERTSSVRETLVGSLGQSPAARVVRVARPYESDD